MKAAIHRLRSMAEGRKDDGVMLVVQAAERYEFVRTMPPIRFAELFQENLRGKLSFDQIVDREMHDKFAQHACYGETGGAEQEMSLENLTAFASAVAKTERKACAKVCRDHAEKIAAEAERLISEEPDEVTALRSTAWQLTVAENEILKRSNVEFSGGAAFAPSAGTQGYAQVLTMRQEAQQPKWKDQRVSPLALKLAEEEHDQGNDMKHLLIAQLKLEGQRKHGN